jgi:glucan phosphoethanolaminetransferase (alkaline phosphatase superfamily)
VKKNKSKNIIKVVLLLVSYLLFFKLSGGVSEQVKNDYPLKALYDNYMAAYFPAENSSYKIIVRPLQIAAKKGAPDLFLLIGESARGRNFRYSGYKNDTNEYTSHIAELNYIKSAKSCRMSTSLSISCMLTSQDNDEYFSQPSQSSIMAYANNNGYDVYFISSGAQDIIGMFKNEIKFIKKIYLSKNAINNNFFKNDDEYIVESLDEILKIRNMDKPILVVMNGMGSHFPYANRVPLEYYDKFKENKSKYSINYDLNKNQLCFVLKGQSYDEHLNWYDASILYTDKIISKIISKIENKNAIFAYTSDHGESLGEDDQACLHGYNSEDVWDVPFMIYGTKSFKDANEHSYGNLMKNTFSLNNLNRPWEAHLSVMPTLLQCAGIDDYYNNKDLSLCLPDFNFSRESQRCRKFSNDKSAEPYCK